MPKRRTTVLVTCCTGGGPAGLASAIMLARRGWKNIEVWERLSRPPSPEASEWGDANRSYNLGVTARGQIVLAKLGVLDRVLNYAVQLDGAMSWTPEKPDEPVSTRRTDGTQYPTQVRETLALWIAFDTVLDVLSVRSNSSPAGHSSQ